MLHPFIFLLPLLTTLAYSSPLNPVNPSLLPSLALKNPTDATCGRTPTSSTFNYLDCLYLLRFLRDRQPWFLEPLLWGDRRPSGPGKTPLEVDRLSCRLILNAVSANQQEAFPLGHFMPRFMDVVKTCLQPENEFNTGTVPVGLGVNFFATIGGAPQLVRQGNEMVEMGDNVTVKWSKSL